MFYQSEIMFNSSIMFSIPTKGNTTSNRSINANHQSQDIISKSSTHDIHFPNQNETAHLAHDLEHIINNMVVA